MIQQKTAYITGATGCVGRNLVDILLEKQWKIIVLHRKSSDLTKLAGLNVECREVELHDYYSVNNALHSKADVLFHIAANVTHNPVHHQNQFRDNVLSTDVLSSMCATQHIVDRFIYCSTGAVARTDNFSLEQINTIRSGYIKTKKLSELIIRKAIVHGGLDAVILRPIIVVGKYDYNNYSQIFNLIKRGKLTRSIPGELAFCNARDVAAAHLSAYYNGKKGETYYLDGEYTTWHDFCCRIANLLNVKKPKKPLPLWFYYLVSHLMLEWQHITKKEALITPELLDLMCLETYDVVTTEEKIKTINDLRYSSSSLDISLNECYTWLKDNNKI